MVTSNTKPTVIILNGFLGSGKTTLFRSLLSQSKKKNIPVCAIVNDMSELDVDGELISNIEFIEQNTTILESIHSCVLSSKKGLKKLNESLQRLLSNQPELIIIETSGSCHPMPLIKYFKEQTNVKLTGVLTLVDSLMLTHDYNYGKSLIPTMRNNLAYDKRDTVNLLVEQIMFCNHLIVTKTDRIEKEKITDIASHIQEINPYVSIYSVLFGKLDVTSLLELQEYDYFKVAKLIEELEPVLESEGQNDKQPYDLATRVIKDNRPFHPQRLWNVCHQYLDKKIYRSKGFFWLASRDTYSLLWNQAAGDISLEIIGTWKAGIVNDNNHGLSEIEVKLLEEKLAKESELFGDRHCDLTVIGDKTQVDKFTEALKSCFLTDEEISLWKHNEVFDDPWPKNIVRVKN